MKRRGNSFKEGKKETKAEKYSRNKVKLSHFLSHTAFSYNH